MCYPQQEHKPQKVKLMSTQEDGALSRGGLRLFVNCSNGFHLLGCSFLPWTGRLCSKHLLYILTHAIFIRTAKRLSPFLKLKKMSVTEK